jgi:hypothetical protein
VLDGWCWMVGVGRRCVAGVVDCVGWLGLVGGGDGWTGVGWWKLDGGH